MSGSQPTPSPAPSETTAEENAASFTFGATIPNVPPVSSTGNIQNLTGSISLTVTVPKKNAGMNGMKTVSMLPNTVTNINFLFIKPERYSDWCRRIICMPESSTTQYEQPQYTGGHEHSEGSIPEVPPSPGGSIPEVPPSPGGHQHQDGSGTTYPPHPPPPPKGGGCYYYPNDPSDPSKGGYYYYPNDLSDPSKGGYYYHPTDEKPRPESQYPTQPPSQYPTQPPSQYPTQPPSQYPTQPPSQYPVALNLKNDLFLIGNPIIRLLGNAGTLTFVNEFTDADIAVSIVIGYDADNPMYSDY
jgi:hypothetical protein